MPVDWVWTVEQQNVAGQPIIPFANVWRSIINGSVPSKESDSQPINHCYEQGIKYSSDINSKYTLTFGDGGGGGIGIGISVGIGIGIDIDIGFSDDDGLVLYAI